MVNSPLIRPAISLGKRGIGEVPLACHDVYKILPLDSVPFRH